MNREIVERKENTLCECQTKLMKRCKSHEKQLLGSWLLPEKMFLKDADLPAINNLLIKSSFLSHIRVRYLMICFFIYLIFRVTTCVHYDKMKNTEALYLDAVQSVNPSVGCHCIYLAVTCHLTYQCLQQHSLGSHILIFKEFP